MRIFKDFPKQLPWHLPFGLLCVLLIFGMSGYWPQIIDESCVFRILVWGGGLHFTGVFR